MPDKVKNLNFDELEAIEKSKDGGKDKDGSEPDNTGDQEELDQFFRDLELQTNGAVFDKSFLEDNSSGDKDDEEKGKKDSSKDIKDKVGSDDELETLKKRYEDSSREAKRLFEENQKLKEYEDFIPILNVMRQDPGLIDHVKDYLSGNTTPQNIKERLQLPEDFVFDFDEAVSDPQSDSAKIFGHYVDMAVSHKINEYSTTQRAANDFEQKKRNFQEQSKLSAEDMQDLENWSKQHEMTWEDIFYLKNRDKREKELVRRTIEEKEKQLKKMKGIHPTLAATGEAVDTEDIDAKVFAAIKEATEGGNINW